VITVPPRHRKHKTSYDQLTSCSSSTPDRYPVVLNLNAPEHPDMRAARASRNRFPAGSFVIAAGTAAAP
jgi:hypothetical protein